MYCKSQSKYVYLEIFSLNNLLVLIFACFILIYTYLFEFNPQTKQPQKFSAIIRQVDFLCKTVQPQTILLKF